MPARTTSFVVLAALLPLAAALDPHRHRDVEGSLDRVEAALNLELLEHVAPRTHLERWFPSLEKTLGDMIRTAESPQVLQEPAPKRSFKRLPRAFRASTHAATCSSTLKARTTTAAAPTP